MRGRNGIDAIEVSGNRRVLRVSFMSRAPVRTLASVQIDGRQRIVGITAMDVQLSGMDDPDLDREIDITVDRPGDFST